MINTSVREQSAEATRELLHAARLLRAAALSDGTSPPGDSTQLASRLQASVIRPLATRLGEVEPVADTTSSKVLTGAVGRELWDLAQRATALCAAAGAAPALIEATAALQDLVCTVDAPEGTERVARLLVLLEGQAPSIRIATNGPLLVTNVTDIHDWLGQPLPSRPITALCRCGASAMKPYCDGSHARGFEDAKDPSRIPDRRDTYLGQQVTIFDNRGACQHSGFCTDRLATVFRLKEEPFVAPSGGRMDEIIRAVRDCPSGALGLTIDGIEARSATDYHSIRQPSIEVSKDGPYRVRGGVALLEPDGAPVLRNVGASLEHFTLCRCGHAQNKPFCTGTHWNVEFRDPLPMAGSTPTIFEWAGGLPALLRMTRLFYEKHVPADELLAPVFANMSADHPQRVAMWLGEVFGGPKYYSAAFGGYARMVSEHLGKCLTEEMRARWVQLLLESAREAKLPNDPEFRAAFQSYLEWGSRLAVENSQHESRPPMHMPMPHWDWNTSAGPPGSRASALAPTDPAFAPHLAAPGEAVTFNAHIKTLFRDRDVKSMKFAFDLTSYPDVSRHADAILERVRMGTMPCDGAWPPAYVDAFARWVAAGKPP